jgi:hypothetical protein
MHTTTTQSSDSLTASTQPNEDTICADSSAYQGAAEGPPEATPPLLGAAAPPPPRTPASTVPAAASGPPDDGHERPRHHTADASAAWRPEVRLPSGPFGFEDTGKPIFEAFSRSHDLFVQHRTVVERMFNRTNGCDELKAVTPSEFRSRLERLGQPVAYRSGEKGHWGWRPCLCSEDNAKGLLGSKAALELLPRISTVVSCPVAVPGSDGKLKRLGRGYHPESGGTLITKGAPVPEVPLKEACDSLWDVLADCAFVTRSDGSRAFAALLAPALAMGGLLGNARIPVDLAVASASQSGKTYRQRLVAAIYGETPYVVAQKAKGVGGLEESVGHGLLSGRPFIQIDNLRGNLDSQYLEALMTAEHIGVRIPHRAETLVNTSRFVVMITSNDMVLTPDLINRSSIIRIRKRPASFKYKSYDGLDILDHVKANQAYYLGCVFSVLQEWYGKGRPRTEENRHDFRVWAGACDYIVQNVAGEFAPLLEGYDTDLQAFDGPSLTDDSNQAFWEMGNTSKPEFGTES